MQRPAKPFTPVRFRLQPPYLLTVKTKLQMMNISIIGAGYVGLVTASCFAELGHNVTCIDVNKSKIKSLKNGNLPFFETGLSDLIIVNQNNGNLKFSYSYKKCFKNINVIFLCVDTP